MSAVENPVSIDSSDLHRSFTESAIVPSPAERASARVYEELGRLAELMPERYREVFCFRWGLRGQFSHLVSQAERKFEIPQSTVNEMLTRCLWNIARHAHEHELPAIREMMAADRARWAERAWAHAERRWGNQESAFSETVLLVAVAGVDVPEAHQVARQHLVDIGRAHSNPWGRPMTARDRADAARHAVDGMLAQVIWPSDPAKLAGLDAFSVRRPLRAWAPAKTGVFRSDKLGRLVQFDSDLELLVLRQCDADPRVVDYREQPVTIPYVIDGEVHRYTPDVLVRLQDGRAFIVEVKSPVGLGIFTNWIKWASLARWCETTGIGFWIGSPHRSIIDHRGLQPDPALRQFVADEVEAGEVAEENYAALRQLTGGMQQLGLIATAELLDWRTSHQRIRHAEGADRDAARQFWALVDQHRYAQLTAGAPTRPPWRGSR